jgi:molybdopterin-guanine dinucleotide biosynthesis protein A
VSPARDERGAIVLAGGRSTRMGRDKASLPFRGETLLARVLRAVRPEVSEVVVVARPRQALPDLPRLPDLVVRVAHDETPDLGPLGGLVAGLRALEAPVAYASSCDVPALSPAFVRAVLDAMGEADVAMAEAQGRLHPLAAAYRRSVLPHVEALLSAGRRRPVDLLERVPHVRIPEAVLRAVDPDLASLDNVNTPEAYEAALRRRES